MSTLLLNVIGSNSAHQKTIRLCPYADTVEPIYDALLIKIKLKMAPYICIKQIRSSTYLLSRHHILFDNEQRSMYEAWNVGKRD